MTEPNTGSVFPEETPKFLVDPMGKQPTVSIACRTGGITKRELFAAMALQGILADRGRLLDQIETGRPPHFARIATEYADALLDELAEEDDDD